jgi:hypothetical protein
LFFGTSLLKYFFVQSLGLLFLLNPTPLLTPGIRFDNPVTTLEYYTCWQKLFGVMEPNMELLIEELMKEICGEIQSLHKEMKDGFTKITTNEIATHSRISEIATTAEQREEHVATLEATTAEKDKSFTAWRQEAKSSLSSVRL